MWVALAKITLFSCPLYINAAGKIASLHLMRQLWLPPERLAFSFYLGRFLTVYKACVGLPSLWSEETLLLGRPLNKPGPTGLGWKSSGHAFTSCYGWAPHGSQGPLLTDEFYPHNSPSKFRLFLLGPRRKRWDFDTYWTVHCEFLLHPCRGVPSRASLMLKAFNDPGGVNCVFLGFYALSIQRLETRSTVDNILFALGGSMSIQLPLSI